MLYGNSTKYAIRALTYMAGNGQNTCQKIEDIARSQKIPKPYLSQIFKRLVEAKILRSVKGPGGGYVLARSLDAINLYDIKLCIDGQSDFTECAIGMNHCSDQTPCAAHDTWKKLRQQAIDSMRKTTLAKASATVARKLNRAKRG